MLEELCMRKNRSTDSSVPAWENAKFYLCSRFYLTKLKHLNLSENISLLFMLDVRWINKSQLWKEKTNIFQRNLSLWNWGEVSSGWVGWCDAVFLALKMHMFQIFLQISPSWFRELIFQHLKCYKKGRGGCFLGPENAHLIFIQIFAFLPGLPSYLVFMNNFLNV